MSSRLLFVFVLLAIAGAPAEAQRRRTALDSCVEFDSNAEIGARLARLQASAPEIVRFFSVGASRSGHELWAVLISASPDEESIEPEVRLVGGIHGDECLSAEMVLTIVEWIVEDYGVDPLTTRLVDEAQVIALPLLNPDGYSGRRATRTNAARVDLNRNLGFAWVDAGGRFLEGPEPFSEPETRALRQISQQQSFTLGLTFHTRADYINGPWNYTPHPPPDAALIDAMGHAYAGDSGYQVVFGWSWYMITGDVNDWSLGARGTLDWTVELRSDRSLEWEVHHGGLRRFLAFAFRGVSGVVVDERTGEPLAARVELASGGAPAFTDPRLGDFHRPLLAGADELIVRAQGHEPRRVPVAVTEGDALFLEIALSPTPDGSPEYGFAVNAMTLPEAISNEDYPEVRYSNRSLAWSALGPPDGVGYSLSPGGSITVDLGEGFGVVDGDGTDLELLPATAEIDTLRVEAAPDQDGAFVVIGEGSGPFAVDLADGGLTEARFIRLVDLSSGPFDHPSAGYDLDALVVTSPRPRPEVGPDGDADADIDADVDGDSDADGDGDSDADGDIDAEAALDGDLEVDRRVAGCGCGQVGGAARGMWPAALFF